MTWTASLSATPGARLLAAILVVLAVVAAGSSGEAASISLTWNAPSTNADGSRLADLAGYRIYLGTTAPSCPSGSFHAVSSPTRTPAAGQTVSTNVTALRAGTTYFVRITALDTSGNESGCSSSASGVAQADLEVAPAASTGFGSVAVGGTVDRTFTVRNTGSASISGAASVGAPFSIVSGASFSLASGASRTITVRFRPTTAGTFAGNVTFTAGGDTVSRGVSGSTTSSATATLSVTRNGTGTGTVTSSPAGIACGSDCTQTVTAGTRMALTASAVSGSTFAGWSGACSGTGACTVTVNTATTVTATFAVTAPARSPVPRVSSLGPASATAGSPPLTLTVNGSGFVPASRVRWNGANRTTTFVSPTQLRAAITAADLASARSVSVTVVTSAPGGGTSGAATFSVRAAARSAVPTVSGLSPARVSAGSGALTLTVNGSGFVPASRVRWNGANRTTTFVSATRLRAAITAADLASARSVSVTVVTPAPGGGTSAAATFTTTPPPPPPAPGAPSVTRTAASATTVTFTIAWNAVSGATSYRYTAAFTDGSGSRQGTVKAPSFRLTMPYHASRAAFGATVCIRSVNASGQPSMNQACRAVPVPARPVTAPAASSPAAPAPPSPPQPDYGWGVG